MIRITVGYITLLGIVTLVADAGGLTDPLERLHEIPCGDKALHFVLVGLLALFVNLSIRGHVALANRFTILSGSALIAVAATCEELSNLVIDGRNWSLGDLAANYLGILFVGVLPVVLLQLWAPRRPIVDWNTPTVS